ncbi:MAG: hypothetical protein GF309_16815 [Candidatus Lokiarchaeota archaeon]|nr:hypothetical protein [Candidatus Lokiarchaeota archaeon]
MTEDIEPDDLSVEFWDKLAELDRKTLESATKKVPELLKTSELMLYSTHKQTRVAVSKHVNEKDAQNITRVLNLAAMYISARELDMEDHFEKEIPEEHRDHILSLIEILKKDDSFPTIYYRLSRIKGFVVPPLYVRRLKLGPRENLPSAQFFELVMRRMDSNGEINNITLEMDSYEIRALIEELRDLLDN